MSDAGDARCPKGVENETKIEQHAADIGRLYRLFERVLNRPPVWASLLITFLFGAVVALTVLALKVGAANSTHAGTP